MKFPSGFFVWILVLSTAPMGVLQSGAAAVDQLQPANIRIDHAIEAENQPVRWIFLDLLRGTGVHGGFAEIAGCLDSPKGYLELKKGTTVGEAMDALVATNPGYEWELKDDVVNLMPRAGVPLLGTRIAKFQMDTTDQAIPAAFQELLGLPEVRKRVSQLDLKAALGHGGPGVVDEHPVPREPVPIHINVQDVSLREAFNRVVQASRKSIWIYREADCKGDKTYYVDVASGY